MYYAVVLFTDALNYFGLVRWVIPSFLSSSSATLFLDYKVCPKRTYAELDDIWVASSDLKVIGAKAL